MDIEYMTDATDVFPTPVNPGAVATIVVVVVVESQITELNRAHTEVAHVYRTYNNVDQAFKKMMINAFEDPYINALSDEILGSANCT
jgi:hypothetical protein